MEAKALGWLIRWALIALAALVVISLALRFWYVTIVVVPAALTAVYYRRKRSRDAEAEALREEQERWEANQRAWRELAFDPGQYSVVISGFENMTAQEDVTNFLCDIPGLRDQSVEDVEALVQRIVHIAPQPVVEGVSQKDAIHVKEALEWRGANVKIKEAVARSNGAARREAIPVAVRREVWQRDGGRCVDCGSRERLEYDHIIAVVNGGSNTARNLELRCEKCNRTKGARV